MLSLIKIIYSRCFMLFRKLFFTLLLLAPLIGSAEGGKTVFSLNGGMFIPTEKGSPYEWINFNGGLSMGYLSSIGIKPEINIMYSHLKIYHTSPFKESMGVADSSIHKFITGTYGLRYIYNNSPVFQPNLHFGIGHNTSIGEFTTTDFCIHASGGLDLGLSDNFTFGPKFHYFGIYDNQLTDTLANVSIFGNSFSHYVILTLSLNFLF